MGKAEFDEYVHVFIIERFCCHLAERFDERGKKAFLHATQHYATQRGRRMARRAIKNGEELTFATYRRYIEWSNSAKIISSGTAIKGETVITETDWKKKVYTCPWVEKFKATGNHEAAVLYCSDLDKSLVRGFNPFIDYEVVQTLQDHPYCYQIAHNVNIPADADLSTNPELQRSFEYHCAHVYWAFNDVVSDIFEYEGEKVCMDVLNDVAKEYGEEMANIIASYRHTNFDRIHNRC